jgi:precorrin-6A/cobalt-precorrin-6A reductase
LRLLILGGTTEASTLAAAIALRGDIDAILSLAGRTQQPARLPLPMRIGGFGGVAGLRAYCQAEGVEAVVDATHPFAVQMSRHVAKACDASKIPLLAFTRFAWTARDRDRWIEVETTEEAARALGEEPRNVFLTQGRQQLDAFASAPQHRYLVRAIERPAAIDALPLHRLILARGPFQRADEEALMRSEGIEFVVSKNSGGEATYAKIEAARNLSIPVVMLRRPPKPIVEQTARLEDVLAWIEAHRTVP